MGDSDYSDSVSVADTVENVREDAELENLIRMKANASTSLFTALTLSNGPATGGKIVKAIALRRKDIFFVSGFCRVTLLKGSLEINGYQLVFGKPTSIKNPAWMPCCRALASSSGPSNRDFDKLLQSHCNGNNEAYHRCSTALQEDSPFCSVFLLEGVAPSDQEWMVAVEDQSQFSQENVTKRLCIGRSKSEQDLLSSTAVPVVQDCSLCTVLSGMIGSADHMKSLKLELMTYPESWTAAVNNVCTSIEENKAAKVTLGVESKSSSGDSVKAVICGAKGVGKSSCLRYAVNSVLSLCRSSVDAICVIDCDIGQPEFTVPGLISLQIVANPILEANHYNMHRSVDPSSSSSSSGGVDDKVKDVRDGIRMGRNQVLCSYYLGDLTTKNDPELLIACLRRLLDQYYALCAEYDAAEAEGIHKHLRKSASSGNLAAKSRSSALSSGNNFSVLMDNDEEQEERSRSKKRKATAAATASASQAVKVLPLLVNTDGFIRYMGEEVLFNVLSSVRPSHIFQFSSRNDGRLASVERYKTLLREEIQRSKNDTAACDSENAADAENAGEGDDVSENAVRVCVLAAGRESPSKRHATDLRDLRVVSYFLGGSSSSGSSGGGAEDTLNLKTRIKQNNISNESSASNSSSGSGDVGGAGGSGLYMSSNILVDLEGTLAVSLLKLTTLIVPFDAVAVQSICGVSPARFLAALNGSMVGIVSLPTKADEGVVPIVSHKLGNHSTNSERTAAGGAVTLHTIPAIPGAKLLPCLGVAVVKCIDVVRQYFALSAPPATIKRIVEATTAATATIAAAGGNSSDGNKSRRFEQPIAPTISIAIVKGEASQQLPNVLLYAPGAPCYPYLSTESTGEGSSKMRARNNVKRRSQQK